MGPGDIIAFIALLTGVILVSVIVLTGYRHRLRIKERQLELQAASHAAPVDAERFEQRLRVLERIATAKSTDLAAQIEDLREPAAN